MGMYSLTGKNVNNYDYLLRDNSKLSIKVGDVWYANIPYADRPGDFEDRPCIIIDMIKGRTSPIDYCVIKCTTKEESRARVKTTLPTTDLGETKWVVCDYDYYITQRHFRRKITEITEDELEYLQYCVSYSKTFVYNNILPDYYDRALRMRYK